MCEAVPCREVQSRWDGFKASDANLGTQISLLMQFLSPLCCFGVCSFATQILFSVPLVTAKSPHPNSQSFKSRTMSCPFSPHFPFNLFCSTDVSKIFIKMFIGRGYNFGEGFTNNLSTVQNHSRVISVFLHFE